MSGIEITRIEDVKVGDMVTLKRGSATVNAPVGKNDTFPITELFVIYLDGFGTIYGKDGWEFVSATREVPEVAWGTAGYATVRGRVNERVMRVAFQGQDVYNGWMTPSLIGGIYMHSCDDVHDFVPDDIEALRADLDAERAKVSDLTGRNAALEALVQEQKRGLQARDTWIEDQAADA